MKAFFVTHYPNRSVDELALNFNAKFGTDKTAMQIKSALSNFKIVSGRSAGDTMRGRFKLFTQEQGDWIVNAYGRMSINDFMPDYIAKFGECHTSEQVHVFIHNHKIKSGRTGQFKKGNVPHNEGVKGWDAGGNSATNRFKPGHVPDSWKPVGSERVTKDGYVQVKIEDPNKWKLKHVQLWELKNGKLPKGRALLFRDNDRLNYSPDNMILITRGELAMLNKSGLNVHSGDAKDTAILLAKIQLARVK
jgi:hypothetical protein